MKIVTMKHPVAAAIASAVIVGFATACMWRDKQGGSGASNRMRGFHRACAYRRFTDEIVSRRNARNAKRIDSERAALQELPDRRSSDYRA